MPSCKPNPTCKDCKGTGKIPLFTSSCDCDCVKRTHSIIEWKTVNPKHLKSLSDFPFKEYFKEYEEPIMTPKLDGSRHLWEPSNE